jgi:hypothetical protein
MNEDNKDTWFLFGVHLRFLRDLRATKKPADHADLADLAVFGNFLCLQLRRARFSA